MILNSVCPSTPVKRGRIRKHRALGGRKSNGLADLLCLPEMPPVMRSYYQQPGADREAKKSNEWVAKANPVQVKTRAFLNDRSNLLLRVKKCLQSPLPACPRCWNDLLWRSEFSFRRRLKCVDEKAAEPRWLNRRATGLSHSPRVLHSREQRGCIYRVRPCQMINALRNAPCRCARLPIGLRIRKPC